MRRHTSHYSDLKEQHLTLLSIHIGFCKLAPTKQNSSTQRFHKRSRVTKSLCRKSSHHLIEVQSQHSWCALPFIKYCRLLLLVLTPFRERSPAPSFIPTLRTFLNCCGNHYQLVPLLTLIPKWYWSWCTGQSWQVFMTQMLPSVRSPPCCIEPQSHYVTVTWSIKSIITEQRQF